MPFLRILLYSVCVCAIGWSVLIFGGPLVIKRVVLGYTNGALVPSGVAVSPKLGISIRRLDFLFQNEIARRPIKGFSRSTEVEWSLFDGKPFLEINLGPTVINNYAAATNINIHTPSFQKIDWQNIFLVSKIDSITLYSSTKINSLTIEGDLHLASAELLNVNIEAGQFSTTDGRSTYSADFIRSDLGQLSFDAPLNEHLFSSKFAIEDIVVPELNLTAPEATIELSATEEARNFKIELDDVTLSEFGGFIENVKVDGSLNNLYVLQELNMESINGAPLKNLPKFPRISVRAIRPAEHLFKAYFVGNLDEFELSNSGNFIGRLPSGNFEVDLEFDRSASTLTSESNISFNTLNASEITGSVGIGFSSEFLKNFGCKIEECELSDFELDYQINFDDEVVSGIAYCPKSLCGLGDIKFSVRTSNTANIFQTLNQSGILSPISSMYLYGLVGSGEKINNGHELKF